MGLGGNSFHELGQKNRRELSTPLPRGAGFCTCLEDRNTHTHTQAIAIAQASEKREQIQFQQQENCLPPNPKHTHQNKYLGLLLFFFLEVL